MRVCVFFLTKFNITVFLKSSSANNLRFRYNYIYSCMKFVLNGPNSKFRNYYVLIKLTHYKTY